MQTIVVHLVEKIKEWSEIGLIRCEAMVKAGGEAELNKALRDGEVKTSHTGTGLKLYFSRDTYSPIGT